MLSFLSRSRDDGEPTRQADRREDPRIDVPETLPGNYCKTVIVGTRQKMRLRIVDISERGMRFRGITDEGRPPKGAIVDMHVTLLGVSFTVRGSIVWVESLREGTEFCGGVRFDETPSNLHQLDMLIKEYYRFGSW